MDNILKTTKMIYGSMYDKNGQMLPRMAGNLGRLSLPEENIKFLKRYMEFALNSKLLNDASNIYVRSPYFTVKSVFQEYNRENPDDPVNVNTAVSNIDYNRRKLNRIFDEDMLTQIIYYPRSADLTKYNKQLNAAMSKYSKGSLFDGKLGFKTGNNASAIRPDEDKIQDFELMISAYRKKVMNDTESRINREFCDVIAYFNYLYSCNDRDDQEDEDYQQMIDFLNCANDEDDYNSEYDFIEEA